MAFDLCSGSKDEKIDFIDEMKHIGMYVIVTMLVLEALVAIPTTIYIFT